MMLHELPAQNGLAVALRSWTHRAHTVILDWLQSVELRRRVHAGLNKGEAPTRWPAPTSTNAKSGDRSFEQQPLPGQRPQPGDGGHRAMEHNLSGGAANALLATVKPAMTACCSYLSPLGWEHINLTGDYLWRSSAKIGAGKFRPLRPLQPA
jgi:hypothetical protein